MRTAIAFVALLLTACSVETDGFPAGMTAAASVSVTATASAGTVSDSGDTTEATGASSDASGTADADDTASDGVEDTGSGDATEGGTTAGDATATATDDTAGTTGAAACTGAPLDAQLDVPPLCAPTCTNIGFNGGDCLGSEICRLKDSVTAVCEACEACGNLNVLCNATIDCDILFTCFMGQCTAMCDLATPQTCGNPAACTEVGHPTHGVCDPNL